jgi:hypothetical protein
MENRMTIVGLPAGCFGRVCALLVVAGIVAGSGTGYAQGPSDKDKSNEAPDKTAQPAVEKALPPRTFDRWVDLQTASFMGRYRYVATSADVVSANQLQDSVALKARLKLDPKGRFSVNAGVATGAGFTGGWNNTGVGTGDAANPWFLKQLFVAAVPAKGVELSYGGLSFVRGESTEITGYDNDGYLTGQRVSVKRPKDLFFDEVSVTFAYLGDLNTPSTTKRYHRLDEANYSHLLASKKATPWLTTSADYTRLSGVSTVRAAVSVKTAKAHIVDAIRYEQYARAGTASAFGFAVFGEKTPVTRLTVGGGYADIDLMYGGLNSDRFNKGHRIFCSGSLKLVPELALSVFATQAVHNAVPISNRTRLDLILTYNALASLKRARLLR